MRNVEAHTGSSDSQTHDVALGRLADLQPKYVTHMDVMNTLTIPYLLDAGIGVIVRSPPVAEIAACPLHTRTASHAAQDPSPVTKANKRVKDVHHHWEIFTPKILVPFISAMEQLCGSPVASTSPVYPFSLQDFYSRLNADVASRRTMSVDPR